MASRSSRASTRTPQQARSRRTREALVEAATRAFEERGYDETTTAEIARRAGVSVGSVYGYFPDKRAILMEIVRDTVEPLSDEILAQLDPAHWQGDDLRVPVGALIETVFKNRLLQPGLQRILWERFFKDPEVRAAVEAIEARIRDAVESLLRHLNGAGRARVADPASAAYVIHTSVEWTGARLVLGGAPDARVDAAVETLSVMIARLIAD